MAFTQFKFERATYQTRGIFNTYVYETDDDYSTVSSQGYFDRCRFKDEDGWQGAYIDLSCSDGRFQVRIDGEVIKVNTPYSEQVIVKTPQDLQDIDSTKVYFIDGVVDFTGTGLNIEVPATGFTFIGHGSDISLIKCTDDNYDLFVSAVGGSGNILGSNCSIEVSGASSKVYNIVDVNGFNAFEFTGINYNNCTSLGDIDSYRQGLEVNTGRFGGTPEMNLIGSWVGGFRISTSIVRGISDTTALFKAGAGFSYSGRFITDINCDLPTNGALIDFSESNIVNDESLIIDGAFVTRNGVLDASDSTIYPNIDHTSVKSNWGNNTGLPNTKKYIKAVCTSEVVTPIAAINTYYPLLGTFAVSNSVQLSMPANGEFELLTGNGIYQVSGTVQIKGTAGDLVDLRVTKSNDSGATYPVEVNHIQLEIANLSGPNDFATYSINFVQELKKSERLRLEVENKTAARNVTMSSESFFIVTEV